MLIPSFRITPAILRPTQRAILERAAPRRPLTSRELAGELSLSRRGITKAAAQLVAAGLLARQGATRAAAYLITERGLTALGNAGE